MESKEKFNLAVIVSLEITLLLLINLTQVTWSYTRRSADELEKIERMKTINVLSCKENGGNALFSDAGNFMRCNFNQ